MPSDPSWPDAVFETWARQAECVITSRLYYRLRIRQQDIYRDAAQHALVKAYQQGHAKLPEYGDFVRWTVTVAIHYANDCLRRIGRERSALEDVAENAPEPSDRDLCPVVQRCLQQVSPQNRQILELRDERGCTFAEIGRTLFSDSAPRASDEALGQRVRRLVEGALAELRAFLLEDGVDPDLWPATRAD